MKKSLMNRIFHKIKLFGFKMQDEMSLDKNLDEFNKIVIDLKNIGKKSGWCEPSSYSIVK